MPKPYKVYKVILKDNLGKIVQDKNGKELVLIEDFPSFIIEQKEFFTYVKNTFCSIISFFYNIIYNNNNNNIIINKLSKDNLYNFSQVTSDNETLPHRRLITPKESKTLPMEIREKSGEVDITYNPPATVVPKTLQPYLEFWRQKGLLIRKDTTKSFAKDIKALKQLVTGSHAVSELTVGFDLGDWERSVSRFAKAAIYPNYHPLNKKKLQAHTISTFIHNPYSPNGNQSLFLHFLEKSAVIVVEPKIDLNPEISEILIKFFLTNSTRASHELPVGELNLFIEGAKKVVSFFKSNKNEIIGYDQHASQPYQQADLLTGSIEAIVNDLRTITPGWFRSQRTFEVRLPNHLRKLGLLN